MPHAQLNYQITENKDATNTVILVHGLFGNLDNLSMIRRELSQHYQIVSVDLPDHGLSPRTSKFSFSEYATYFAELIDSLNIQGAFFIGHSLGGKIGMKLALDYPEKISKLVVGDIAPVTYPRRHDNVISGLSNVDLASIKTRKDAEEAMSKFIVDAGTKQFLLKSLGKDENNWTWRFNLPLLIRDYEELIQGFDNTNNSQIPVLFLKGANSDYILAEHRPRIIDLFPNSEAKIIQGAGHWLHAEKPAAFARLCERFFAK